MALQFAKVTHELSKTKHSLLPHQVDAVKWMIRRETTKKANGEKRKGPFGGILADDMGLGKTLETIALILSGSSKNTLVIVPANLTNQWISEFQKFAPHLKITTNPEVHKDTENAILIVSYIKAIRSRYIETTEWNRIILDEAHYIRNPKGTVHKKIVQLHSNYKWCLTGTPIQNYVKDIQSLLAFIGISKKRMESMEDVLKKYMLRRTKDGLKFDLPPITYETELVEFRTLYEKMFYEKVKRNTFMVKDVHHLEILLRLRQASLLPQIVHDGYSKKTEKKKQIQWKYSNSKIDRIVKTLEEHPDEKPIIFCYFTKEIEYITHKLKEKEISYKMINGSVSMDERQSIIQNADQFRVMVVQMMAGSTGLNLQAFNSVYFSGPHWNPTHEQQAIARVYRIGQMKPVTVRRFIMKDTIEELIVKIQQRKNEMIGEFMTDK